MEISAKFKIGDKVYCASHVTEKKASQCPDCLGKKVWKVSTPSGLNFTAPCGTCSIGYESCGNVSEYIVCPDVQMLTIGSVRINTEDEKSVSYMCKETGVGSGRIHYEDTLFVNEVDALARATQLAEEITKQNIEHNVEYLMRTRKEYRPRNPLRKK